MKNVATFLFATVLGLVLTACVEDQVTISAPNEGYFSGPGNLMFNEREMTVLNQELTLERALPQPAIDIPFHVQSSSGAPSTVFFNDSDLRKAALGRVLFYDKALSATGETSCASCHLQDKAFADPKAFSDGINGAVTKRNSIALGSVPAFTPQVSGYGRSADEVSSRVEGRLGLFWDERARTVKEQSTLTIQDEIEMGHNLEELAEELRSREIYKILTMKAYGTTDLTADRITLALEKFTSQISSMNTAFDAAEDYFLIGDRRRYSEAQLRGREIFMQDCATCHGSSLTIPRVLAANNGLERTYADEGIGALSGNVNEIGVFKVPFLRNVALTAPYMHDGRFETLREVVDHYSEGIQDHRNLHPNLRVNPRGAARNLNLSEEDKVALVEFLRMLTDEDIRQADHLQNPFRE